ncbi:hypothetical protein DSO57_1037991 [Entomophthora muscae]|uniref:Uncharacterized protein n=1 Tax=Entomophthora muscae TaxID=34485 RepID=A0ACC2UJJ9_9FUNG|nr:hypothetical protein DSO57_1037991 [Entomophthora muscae]
MRLLISGSRVRGPYKAYAAIAQLGERQTEDLKVPRSIRGGRNFFVLIKSLLSFFLTLS